VLSERRDQRRERGLLDPDRVLGRVSELVERVLQPGSDGKRVQDGVVAGPARVRLADVG
jgi:hypothetical protein